MSDQLTISQTDFWRQRSIGFLRERCVDHCEQRAAVITQKINAVLPEIFHSFGINDYKNVADPYVINYNECIMKFVNYWTRKYLNVWPGVCMNRVLNPQLLTYEIYVKIARNSADQKKHNYEHFFWKAILTTIVQYANDLSQRLFIGHSLLQKIVSKCFLWKFIIEIMAAKVKYPQSKAMSLITNRVLIENTNMANFLKIFIDSEFDVCSWYATIEAKLRYKAMNNNPFVTNMALKKIRFQLQKEVNLAFNQRCLQFCHQKLTLAMQKFNKIRYFPNGFNPSTFPSNVLLPFSSKPPSAAIIHQKQQQHYSNIKQLEFENQSMQQIINLLVNMRNLKPSMIGTKNKAFHKFSNTNTNNGMNEYCNMPTINHSMQQLNISKSLIDSENNPKIIKIGCSNYISDYPKTNGICNMPQIERQEGEIGREFGTNGESNDSYSSSGFMSNTSTDVIMNQIGQQTPLSSSTHSLETVLPSIGEMDAHSYDNSVPPAFDMNMNINYFENERIEDMNGMEDYLMNECF